MEWGEICPWNAVGIDFAVVIPFLGQPMKPKERYIARLDEVSAGAKINSDLFSEGGCNSIRAKSGV
jgi:hypothetical protein